MPFLVYKFDFGFRSHLFDPALFVHLHLHQKTLHKENVTQSLCEDLQSLLRQFLEKSTDTNTVNRGTGSLASFNHQNPRQAPNWRGGQNCHVNMNANKFTEGLCQ